MDQCLWKPEMLNEKQGMWTASCRVHRPLGVYAWESMDVVCPSVCPSITVRNFLVAVRKGRMSRSSCANNSPLATRDDEQVCVETMTLVCRILVPAHLTHPYPSPPPGPVCAAEKRV